MTHPQTQPTPPTSEQLLAQVLNSAREPVIINGRVWTSVDADAWCQAIEHVITTQDRS